ncbi:hypothetical protein J437_LFUL018024 [Ladona fulva]|uniref:V(D)J recombination-activating protein 1 RNase H domain-containing protein n=1 Tax=Ladona fulva TaxID=123851 RepID=A0A8K0KQF3_LADFU|nr:hypothetical protein J437_LFUL018024 [Ladona fulva]
MVQELVLRTLSSHHRANLTLISKWGCDGSSGHSIYKQSAEYDFDENSLFFTSVVPLQLYTFDENSEKVVVWQNPKPSSTRYCRPLRLEFIKETTSHIQAAINSVEEEIRLLKPSEYSSEVECSVKHSLRLIMVDGNVCNAITNNRNTQKCIVCGAKQNEMNNIEQLLGRDINHNSCKLGISPLHSLIKTFECLLHISYKIDVKKWKCYQEEDKSSIQERKNKIKLEFRKKLGLVIDCPKQGFGSSNDGNTARKFFDNASVSASITGLD